MSVNGTSYPTELEALNNLVAEANDTRTNADKCFLLTSRPNATLNLCILVGMGVVCAIGIPVNILSCVVFSRSKSTNSSIEYLRAISVVDTVRLLEDLLYVCLTTLVYTGHCELWVRIRLASAPYTYYTFNCLLVTTTWFTVATAFDRKLQAAHPKLAQRYCKRRYARYVCYAIILISMLLCIPYMFRYVRYDPARRGAQSLLNLWHLDRQFPTYYYWTMAVAKYLIPLTFLCYFNTCIVQAIVRNQAIRKHGHAVRSTCALLGLTISFSVTMVPHVVLEFLSVTSKRKTTLVASLNELADFLLDLLTAINFIIYCCINPLWKDSFEVNVLVPVRARMNDMICNYGDATESVRGLTEGYANVSPSASHSSRRQRTHDDRANARLLRLTKGTKGPEEELSKSHEEITMLSAIPEQEKINSEHSN